MSIKIHHGFPGSYKTSGAVQDDFIPAVLEGRHIITNVRGLDSEDNIRDVLEREGKTVPESFRLTHLDTSSSENMEMLRRFFHWSPPGAFFLLDEIQEIYPRSFRDSHVNALNYPGGLDAATAAGKPSTLALAFEKHRHYNWDMVVTTPHINKVHQLVRGCSEGGYKHKNLAVLGSLFKGRYVEGYHPADTNGKTSDFYNIQRKSIKSYVFDLYKSTATGKATDTTAGQSIFKNAKVLGLLLLVGALIAFLSTLPVPKAISGGAASSASLGPAPTLANPPLPASQDSKRPANDNNIPVDSGRPKLVNQIGISLDFLSWDGFINGTGDVFGKSFYKISFLSPDGKKRVELDNKLADVLHLHVVFYSPCYAQIKTTGADLAYVQCPPEPEVMPDKAPDKNGISTIAVNSGVNGANAMVNPFASSPPSPPPR